MKEVGSWGLDSLFHPIAAGPMLVGVVRGESLRPQGLGARISVEGWASSRAPERSE